MRLWIVWLRVLWSGFLGPVGPRGGTGARFLSSQVCRTGEGIKAQQPQERQRRVFPFDIG